MTLNLYSVGTGDAVGSPLYSFSANQFIPWRPEDSASCSSGGWLASDGNCYHGLGQPITFNTGEVNVPNEFVCGLVFNTTNYGPNPTRFSGLYDSLNVGLNTDSTSPSIGSDIMPGSAYCNTSYGPF